MRATLERPHRHLHRLQLDGLVPAAPARRPACRRPSWPSTAAAAAGRCRGTRRAPPRAARAVAGIGAGAPIGSRFAIAAPRRRRSSWRRRAARRRRRPCRRPIRNCASRVAWPTTSGSTPVASGSSVPVWPMRCVAERAPRRARRRRARSGPAGLSTSRTPFMSGRAAVSRGRVCTPIADRRQPILEDAVAHVVERPGHREAGGVLVAAAAVAASRPRGRRRRTSIAC